jgi:hypothetical protein
MTDFVPTTVRVAIERNILRITDEHRSLIASALVNTRRYGDEESWALCCADDAIEACAAIVGDRFARALYEWCHDELGCGKFSDRRVEREVVQRFLDKITELRCLRLS